MAAIGEPQRELEVVPKTLPYPTPAAPVEAPPVTLPELVPA